MTNWTRVVPTRCVRDSVYTKLFAARHFAQSYQMVEFVYRMVAEMESPERSPVVGCKWYAIVKGEVKEFCSLLKTAEAVI